MLLIGTFLLRITTESYCESKVTNYNRLLGESLSGKTTIFNHLQILYGSGITQLERLTAFESILRNLIDIFIDALHLLSETQDHDRQETDSTVRNPVTYYILC